MLAREGENNLGVLLWWSQYTHFSNIVSHNSLVEQKPVRAGLKAKSSYVLEWKKVQRKVFESEI